MLPVYCCNKECQVNGYGKCGTRNSECMDRKPIENINYKLQEDDLGILNKLKEYIPYSQKNVWGWVEEVEKQIREQLDNYE